MQIDYSDTVNIHINMPRQLVEALDANRNRHTTRTIQIIRAVEAYISELDEITESEQPSNLTWSFRV